MKIKKEVKKSRKIQAALQIANLILATLAFTFLISTLAPNVNASIIYDNRGRAFDTIKNEFVNTGPYSSASPPSSLLPAKVITTPVTPTVHSFYGDAQNVNGVTPLNPSGTTLPKMDLKNVDRVDIFSDHAIVYHNDGQATVRVSVDDGNAIQSQAKFEEISAPEIPILGGTSFAISALLKGIIFAGLVVGAIQLIGNLVGADKTLINALSGAAGGGIFMGMLTTGLIKEAGAGLQPGFLGMTNALGERGIKIRVNNNLKVVKE